jgi:sec-independent protein translocase protein TatA
MVSSFDCLLLAFPSIGMPELLIFMAILLLLFGSAKLPALMRNMGRSINEFKAGIKEKPRDVSNVEDMSESKSSS